MSQSIQNNQNAKNGQKNVSKQAEKYPITKQEGFNKCKPNQTDYISLIPSNSVNGRAAFFTDKNNTDKIVKIQTNKSADPILADYIILKKLDEGEDIDKSFLMDIDSFFFLPLTNEKIDLKQYYANPSKNVYPAIISSANKNCAPLESFIKNKLLYSIWLPELEVFYKKMVKLSGHPKFNGFCHNDLHVGNVLYVTKDGIGKFILIDYGRCRINEKDFNTTDKIVQESFNLWSGLRNEQIAAANIDILEALNKYPNNGDLLVQFMNGMKLNSDVHFPYDLNMDITGLTKYIGGMDNMYADLGGLSMYIVQKLGDSDNSVFKYLKHLNYLVNRKLSYIDKNFQVEITKLEDLICEAFASLLTVSDDFSAVWDKLIAYLDPRTEKERHELRQETVSNAIKKYHIFSSTIFWFLEYKVKYTKTFEDILQDFSPGPQHGFMYAYGQVWADNYHALVDKIKEINGPSKNNSPILQELSKKLIPLLKGGRNTRSNTINRVELRSNVLKKQNPSVNKGEPMSDMSAIINALESKKRESELINNDELKKEELDKIPQEQRGWEYVYKLKEKMDGKIRLCACSECTDKRNSQ